MGEGVEWPRCGKKKGGVVTSHSSDAGRVLLIEGISTLSLLSRFRIILK